MEILGSILQMPFTVTPLLWPQSLPTYILLGGNIVILYSTCVQFPKKSYIKSQLWYGLKNN